jgi:hypothetical protein
MIGAAVQKKPLTPDKCQCCGAVNPQFPTAESPFCVGCAERKQCNVQSPLSGYEPVYMPKLYNKKVYVQHNHNCFAYAFDIMDLPTPEECNGNDKDDCKVPFHQPGYASGQKRFDESGEKRCFDLFTRLKSDMPAIEIARNGRPIQFTDKCAKDYSKIALVIDPKQDYHFYRQDSNGFWSHKPGGTAVTNKDSAGRLIYNPELANRDNRKDDNKDGLNYNVFCGFMCVPRTLPNRAKRGGGKGKTRRRVRGGMSVSKEMLPWLRKTQRLIGGMNNNLRMNGTNGYGANVEGPPAPAPGRRTSSRAVRKPRVSFVPTSVTKSRRAAPRTGTRSVATRGKKTQKTQMPSLRNVQKAVGHIFSELERKYPGVDISDEHKDYIKKTLPLYYTTYDKPYISGKLYGIIRKYFKNSADASNVVGMFRNANILPERGQTKRNPKKMTNFLVHLNARTTVRPPRASRSAAPAIADSVPPTTGTAAGRAARAAAREAKKVIADALTAAAAKPKRAPKSRKAKQTPLEVATERAIDAIAESGATTEQVQAAMEDPSSAFGDIMADLMSAINDAETAIPEANNEMPENNAEAGWGGVERPSLVSAIQAARNVSDRELNGLEDLMSGVNIGQPRMPTMAPVIRPAAHWLSNINPTSAFSSSYGGPGGHPPGTFVMGPSILGKK